MQEKNRVIVILGSGAAQLPFIKSANALFFKTIVFDVKRQIGSKYADEFYELSVFETQKIINILKKEDKKISAVVARVTNIKGLNTASAIAKEFDVKFASNTLLKIATDKNLLFQFCLDNDILIPKTYFIDSFEDLKSIYVAKKDDFIIKPSMTIEGKKNIIRFDSKDNIDQLYIVVKNSSGNNRVVVQEYIEGFDFNVLVKFKNSSFEIVASWDEYIAIKDNNHIKGLGLSSQSKALLNEEVLNKLHDTLTEFLRLLKNEEYFIAFTFRLDNSNNIYVIELHCDLIGDLIAERLLPASCSKFDFFKLVIEFLLGRESKEEFIFTNSMLLYDKDLLLKNQSLQEEIALLSKEKKIGNYKSLEYLDYLKGNSVEN